MGEAKFEFCLKIVFCLNASQNLMASATLGIVVIVTKFDQLFFHIKLRSRRNWCEIGVESI